MGNRISQREITHWFNKYYPPLDFKEGDLSNLDLSFGNFLSADLSGAWLNGSNLRGTNFSSANLNNTHLTDAEYNEKTIWPAGFDPKAKGAKFYTRVKDDNFDIHIFVAEEELRKKGSTDWVCHACRTVNTNLRATCLKCGRERHTSDSKWE